MLQALKFFSLILYLHKKFVFISALLRLALKVIPTIKTSNAPGNTADVYRASLENRQARGGESRNRKRACQARFSLELEATDSTKPLRHARSTAY